MTRGRSQLLFFIAIVLSITPIIFGQSIKFIEETPLEPGPGFAVDFCVHKDMIIIPDQDDDTVKIYKKGRNGNVYLLDNEIRHKDFKDPAYCYIDDRYLAILDLGSRKILIFKIKGLDKEIKFTYNRTIPCPHLGYDLQIYKGKLYISGYTEDKYQYSFELYSIDLENNQKKFLLPAHTKYGFDSNEQYIEEYETNPDISMVGVQSYFDINRNSIYYSWEASSKIIKIDFAMGPSKPIVFGNPPHNLKTICFQQSSRK